MEYLQEFHEQLLDILLEFDRICKSNDIVYSLAFGTLLGAVRHNGFIPWDDDVDVMLDRNNFDKFCEVCPKCVGKDYFFQSKITEKKYPYNICRLRKNNTAMIYDTWKESGIHLGIYIDIYPVDNLADNKFKRSMQKLAIIVSTPVRIARNPVIFKTGGNKFNSTLKNIIYYCTKICPKKLFDKLEHHNLVHYDDRECKECGIICEGGTLIRTPRDMKPFSTEFMKNYTEVDFEGHRFCSIANYNDLLTHWYGDYMKLPPESERGMYHKPEIFDTKHSYNDYI